MQIRLAVPLLAFSVCLAVAGWAKDELIPTSPKSREREEPPNPLRDVASDMHAVGRRLKEAKTDDTTQAMERTIVEKLEILVEMARQQQEKESKGGQGDAKQRQEKKEQPQPELEKKKQDLKKEEVAKKAAAAQQKKEKKADRPGMGRPGVGEATGTPPSDAERWGDLPPAIRDQLLQTQAEGFPLKYRELLRRYYRVLAKPKE